MSRSCHTFVNTLSGLRVGANSDGAAVAPLLDLSLHEIPTRCVYSVDTYYQGLQKFRKYRTGCTRQ